MYGIAGERDLTEHTLDHLSGWRGARPVRVGNGAWNQQQHDVWGMIIDAIDVQFHLAASQIATPTWEGLATFVDAALQHWREPDQGIWEVRGDPKHFVASKVMCWVAAARGADLADSRGEADRAKRWRAGADEIKAEVLEKGVSDRGVFRQHYETDDLDASLLLLPIMGFLPPDDKRIIATVLAIADELTQDGLVLRYKVEGTDTGFSGDEGTFTICSFWLVTALAMIGEQHRARALCEKLLSFAGTPDAVRGRDRRDHRPASRQLPAGLHASGADRGGVAAHRDRARRRVRPFVQSASRHIKRGETRHRRGAGTDPSSNESSASPAAPAGLADAEPDARFTFANERTFLAWSRTALALVTAGLAIVQLLPAFPGVPWGRRIIGTPLILLGSAVAIVSYLEWRGNQRALRRGEPLGRSRLPGILAVTIAAVGLIAVALSLLSAEVKH